MATLDPANESIVSDVNAYVGARVVRGAKWPYGDQDGGEEERNDGGDGRSKGTLIGFRTAAGVVNGDAPASSQYARVQWDLDSTIHMYRIGAGGFSVLEFSEDKSPYVPPQSMDDENTVGSEEVGEKASNLEGGFEE